MAKVLIVEDDLELLEKLRDWLIFEKYVVEEAHNGRQALDMVRFYKYDVIVLDWMLPDLSGIEVCRQYRATGGSAPILILTGKREISDKEKGFTSGADDYLTKPFDTRELSARIRALLRRPRLYKDNILKVEDLTLDTGAHTVSRSGRVIELQPLEFQLLEFLLRHSNQVYSPEALLNHVWGAHSDASVDTIRTYIKTLRRKIDVEGKASVIKTVHGVGYKLDNPEL